MSPSQPLLEAGLSLQFENGGTRLIVKDVDSSGCLIRNRGGEALASLLQSNRSIKALDLRQSSISDNGLALLSLTLRQTDQLEDLHLSPIGHSGFQFLLGILRRCSQLQLLSVEVRDVATLFVSRQTLSPSDYNVSGYVVEKGEEQEEEDEEAEAKRIAKVEKLKKLLAETDYDSEEETLTSSPVNDASPALGKLLSDMLALVRQRPNLLHIECRGDAVPKSVQSDLERIGAEHRALQEKKDSEKIEMSSRTADDAMKDQMFEIRNLMAKEDDLGQQLPGEQLSSTRLGIRSFIGRRLHDALGEALFECQRYKAKGNEAVSTPEGEMAFIAMYMRRLMAKEAIEAAKMAQ